MLNIKWNQLMSRFMSRINLLCKNFLTFVDRIVNLKVFKFINISMLAYSLFEIKCILQYHSETKKNFLLLPN